jgi:hypothetical protein
MMAKVRRRATGSEAFMPQQVARGGAHVNRARKTGNDRRDRQSMRSRSRMAVMTMCGNPVRHIIFLCRT